MNTRQQRIEEEQRAWNGVALLVYLALCALSVWLVARFGTFEPNAISFLDLAVLGLAALRLVHLITYDKIFDMVRAAFMDREGERLKNAERGWRRLMCEFMQRIWCTGMWSGLIVVTIYYVGVWGRYAAIVLAVAGLGSLLQLLSKAFAAQGQCYRRCTQPSYWDKSALRYRHSHVRSDCPFWGQ